MFVKLKEHGGDETFLNTSNINYFREHKKGDESTIAKISNGFFLYDNKPAEIYSLVYDSNRFARIETTTGTVCVAKDYVESISYDHKREMTRLIFSDETVYFSRKEIWKILAAFNNLGAEK